MKPTMLAVALLAALDSSAHAADRFRLSVCLHDESGGCRLFFPREGLDRPEHNKRGLK